MKKKIVIIEFTIVLINILYVVYIKQEIKTLIFAEFYIFLN